MNNQTLPLAGIRVLELGAYIAAPYGCTLLADQGAEVIKIEPPGGDNLRSYPSTLNREGRAFVGVNRGKLGMAMDLKRAEARAILIGMVPTTDVLVHNFRPGVPERLGIDYATLLEINPRLIYCAVSGFGESGLLKDRAGYDQVLQAMTGIASMQGADDEPQLVYGSVVDYYAASLLATSVCAALYEREGSGRGRYVAVSLLRSALAMQSARFVWSADEPRDISRDMRSGGVTGLHPTREGYLYISANTPHFWTALCELIGLPQLSIDPRYDSVKKRASLADEILPPIRTALKQHSAAEWEAIFGERVPSSAVRSIGEMFEDPQVIAEGMVGTFEHPSLGRYRGLSSALDFCGHRDDGPRASPGLGQHTSEILGRYGLGTEAIAELRRIGVVA